MNQPQTFAPGDIVALKSWSPKMTVNAVSISQPHTSKAKVEVVHVVWFNHSDSAPRRDSFPPSALELWVDPAVRDRLAAMAEQGIDVRPAA